MDSFEVLDKTCLYAIVHFTYQDNSRARDSRLCVISSTPTRLNRTDLVGIQKTMTAQELETETEKGMRNRWVGRA